MAKAEGAHRPERIGTEKLICEHGALLIDFTSESECGESIGFITMEDWSTLLSL